MIMMYFPKVPITHPERARIMSEDEQERYRQGAATTTGMKTADEQGKLLWSFHGVMLRK